MTIIFDVIANCCDILKIWNNFTVVAYWWHAYADALLFYVF